MTKLQNTVNHAIPVYIPEEKFNEIIFPALWVGSRGPKPKLSYFKIFHYILYVLYTGVQWKMLPIEKGEDGQPEIHYSNIWRKWDQWVTNQSIREVFDRSVRCLNEKGRLDLSVLNGDGSNIVAKKGGNPSAIAGTNIRKGIKFFLFVTMPATYWRPW